MTSATVRKINVPALPPLPTLDFHASIVSNGDVEPYMASDAQPWIPVAVGHLTGYYSPHHHKVVDAKGTIYTPTGFECAGGKENNRKWRLSLRVLLPNGYKGKTLGMWLIAHGLDHLIPQPTPRRGSGSPRKGEGGSGGSGESGGSGGSGGSGYPLRRSQNSTNNAISSHKSPSDSKRPRAGKEDVLMGEGTPSPAKHVRRGGSLALFDTPCSSPHLDIAVEELHHQQQQLQQQLFLAANQVVAPLHVDGLTLEDFTASPPPSPNPTDVIGSFLQQHLALSATTPLTTSNVAGAGAAGGDGDGGTSATIPAVLLIPTTIQGAPGTMNTISGGVPIFSSRASMLTGTNAVGMTQQHQALLPIDTSPGGITANNNTAAIDIMNPSYVEANAAHLMPLPSDIAAAVAAAAAAAATEPGIILGDAQQHNCNGNDNSQQGLENNSDGIQIQPPARQDTGSSLDLEHIFDYGDALPHPQANAPGVMLPMLMSTVSNANVLRRTPSAEWGAFESITLAGGDKGEEEAKGKEEGGDSGRRPSNGSSFSNGRSKAPSPPPEMLSGYSSPQAAFAAEEAKGGNEQGGGGGGSGGEEQQPSPAAVDVAPPATSPSSAAAPGATAPRNASAESTSQAGAKSEHQQ